MCCESLSLKNVQLGNYWYKVKKRIPIENPWYGPIARAQTKPIKSEAEPQTCKALIYLAASIMKCNPVNDFSNPG